MAVAQQDICAGQKLRLKSAWVPVRMFLLTHKSAKQADAILRNKNPLIRHQVPPNFYGVFCDCPLEDRHRVDMPAESTPSKGQRCRILVPPCYVPEGDSPLSLYATALSSKVVLASVSRHRAGVRATVPAVQVRGECSYGTCRSSQQARLGLLPSLSSSSAVVLRKGGDLARGETFWTSSEWWGMGQVDYN